MFSVLFGKRCGSGFAFMFSVLFGKRFEIAFCKE
jgi:hypothetical protein